MKFQKITLIEGSVKCEFDGKECDLDEEFNSDCNGEKSLYTCDTDH